MDNIDISSLPSTIQDKLRELERELAEGDITQRGFEKKKNALLAQFRQQTPSSTSNQHYTPQISTGVSPVPPNDSEQQSPYKNQQKSHFTNQPGTYPFHPHHPHISPRTLTEEPGERFGPGRGQDLYSNSILPDFPPPPFPPPELTAESGEKFGQGRGQDLHSNSILPDFPPPPFPPPDLATESGERFGPGRGQDLHSNNILPDSQPPFPPPVIPPQHPGRGMRSSQQYPLASRNVIGNYRPSPPRPSVDYGSPSYRPTVLPQQQRPTIQTHPTSQSHYGFPPPVVPRPFRPQSTVRPIQRPLPLVDNYNPRTSGDFQFRNRTTEQVRSQLALEDRNPARGSIEIRSSIDVSDVASIKSFKSNVDIRSIYDNDFLLPRFQEDNISIRSSRSNSIPIINSNIGLKYGQNDRRSQNRSYNRGGMIPSPLPDTPTFDSELSKLAGKQFMPFEPRMIPFPIVDPLNLTQMMSSFQSIAHVLRHRGTTTPKKIAFVSIDPKGKEVSSWTWEKLHGRAEKIAQMISKNRNTARGDRVALIYRKSEVMDFLAALYGCFIAGVVAVPINAAEEFVELCYILSNTGSRLALTTDHNLKVFTRDLAARRKELPSNVEWWKTNEFGSYHPKKKDDFPLIEENELAYVEYTKAHKGILKGVKVSHRTIMEQCRVMLGSVVEKNLQINLQNTNPTALVEHQQSDTLLTYLDPRQQVGLILGALWGVYCGNTTVFLGSLGMEVPGLWVNCISKYKVTIALADYPGLNSVVNSYKQDPALTLNFNKKITADLSSLRFLFIDALVIDPERNDDIAEILLKPLGVPFPHDVLTPVSSLPEHGGTILSFGDLIGVEGLDERFEGHRNVREYLLDREALKNNIISVVDEETLRSDGEPRVLRVGAFGFVMPGATIAIVDPETRAFCLPNTVGEIWVDSPSLNEAFWEPNRDTQSIFRAQPLVVYEATGIPELFDQEFLRTGLLGCLIYGQLVVFGLYEDRIKQLAEIQPQQKDGEESIERWEFHYTIDLEKTLLKHLGKDINDCAAFQSFVNDEFLPVIIAESPLKSGILADQIMNILETYHGIRIYCVMICSIGTLPRTWKNGKKLVNSMLCQRYYELGRLKPICVKTAVDRTILNIPIGIDPEGGIWGTEALKERQSLNLAAPGLRRQQFTGMEVPQKVLDDRTGFELTKFESIVGILTWRSHIAPDDPAFTSLDVRGREGKSISWKKFDMKIAQAASHLQKKGCKAGDHTILVFPHGLDYIVAVYACLVLGMTPIPFAPPDVNRAKEDVSALLQLVEDFKIEFFLVNTESETILKAKHVQSCLKSVGKFGVKLPQAFNITKAQKIGKTLKEADYGVKNEWLASTYPALVLCYFSADVKRSCVKLGHDTLLALCKVQKETCRMTSTRAIMSCESSFSGIGFVQSVLLGIYIGSPTILHSPADYYANPLVLIDNLGHFKIENTYTTFPMMLHAVSYFSNTEHRPLSLQSMKNLMIPVENRPNPEYYKKISRAFFASRLDDTAISYVYSHPANPIVTTRSHMFIKPFELLLDLDSLRRGVIRFTENSYEGRKSAEMEESMYETRIHDSGMVPISTQIAIVHPETRRLCPSSEFGEIWITSDANAKSFYGSNDPLDRDRFSAVIEGGDPRVRWVRTGDLGFLHTVQKPADDKLIEFQCLFYLGPIAETFEVNGLMHFYCDVEYTIERWCNDKWPVKLVEGPCCVVFHTNGQTYCVVEVRQADGILSLVPAILKVVLDVHQFVLDVIAFMAPGTMPRSRHGEKQRVQVLSGYINKTLSFLHVHHVKEPSHQNSITVPNTALLANNITNSSEISYASTTNEASSNVVAAAVGSNSNVIVKSSLPTNPTSATNPAATFDYYVNNEKNSMINMAEPDAATVAGRTSNLLDDENWEQVEKVELEDELLVHRNLPKMPISAIPEEPPTLTLDNLE